MRVTVKAARAMAGLTQDQAANKMGISRAAYMYIEKHPERTPIERAQKLCDVFGMPMEAINFLSSTPQNVE